MWIIPKNLPISHSALDMVESTLDFNELSEMCEQSLLWRSKPSRARTWSQRWKRVSWMRLLSGRILKLSLGNSFAERWTSSLEASLASHSLPLALDEEATTRATCGHTSREGSDLSDLPLFSWRTSKGSSPQSSRAITGQTPKERQWLSMSSESFSAWVTNQRREHSARLKSARLTNERELSSWRSPTASAIGEETGLVTRSGEPWRGEGRAYRADGTNKQHDLNLQVLADGQPGEASPSMIGSHRGPSPKENNWKTPTAAEGGEIGNSINKGQIGLSNDPILEQGMVKTFPTPCARDYKDMALKKQRSDRRSGKPRLEDSLPQAVLLDVSYRGDLNPRWVEKLMGLEIGWVASGNKIDELRLLGNGVVPQTAERAFLMLASKMLPRPTASASSSVESRSGAASSSSQELGHHSSAT